MFQFDFLHNGKCYCMRYLATMFDKESAAAFNYRYDLILRSEGKLLHATSADFDFKSLKSIGIAKE